MHDFIINHAQKIRSQYNANKINKETSNNHFQNKHTVKKHFTPGQMVLDRQLQVSTRAAGKWSPVHTGPFIIEQIDGSDKTAICKNLIANKTIKAHLSNLNEYRHSDKTLRVCQVQAQT